jgi:hypothetical protein
MSRFIHSAALEYAAFALLGAWFVYFVYRFFIKK